MKLKLVIGFTGLLASGKTTAAREAARELGAPLFSLGDEVRAEARRRGIRVTRESLQRLSAAVKKCFGASVWAWRVIKKIRATPTPYAVIEGFRNLAEVRAARRAFGKKFVFITVKAPVRMRYQRAKRRMRESEATHSLAAFKQSEAREARGLGGWELRECERAADCVVLNNSSLTVFKERVKGLVKKLRG